MTNTSIWTVTTISIKETHATKTRTWGYYFTEEDAVAGVHNNCSDEAGYYTHAVVENFAPGIYTIAGKEIWFVWRRDDGWNRCDKPESQAMIINYGIG